MELRSFAVIASWNDLTSSQSELDHRAWQAAEQEARRKSAESHAASLQQRDVRLAQIEELKERILAERCSPQLLQIGSVARPH